MTAKLAIASLVLFAGALFAAPQAHAQTYQLTCTPVGLGATLSATVIVVLQPSGASVNGSALMDFTLRDTNGSAPVTVRNVQVNGQIENAVDQNVNQPYQVLFAQPSAKNDGISYARIAIGDNSSSTLSNSYVRDFKGTYYYAHCK